MKARLNLNADGVIFQKKVVAFLKPCASHPDAKGYLLCVHETSRDMPKWYLMAWELDRGPRMRVHETSSVGTSKLSVHIILKTMPIYPVSHSRFSYNSGLIQDGLIKYLILSILKC